MYMRECAIMREMCPERERDRERERERESLTWANMSWAASETFPFAAKRELEMQERGTPGNIFSSSTTERERERERKRERQRDEIKSRILDR
jgi:hypothetical protein